MRRFWCFLLCLLFLAGLCFGEEAYSDKLVIQYLDVGQGDAIIIQCGGKTLMIDGGDRDSNQFIYSYLKNTLQLDYIDYMISTHPHDDHVKGLATALVVCDAGTIYSPVTEYDGDGFRDFMGKVSERGKAITIPRRGESFMLGGATVAFLSDPHEGWKTNDQSLVVKITFGITSFLFMGDAEGEAEIELIESGQDLKADILKVGHHGSVSSSTPAFIDAVKPAYAIISVGENNVYGHPDEEVLHTLRNRYVNIYRTDKHGTIICTSDGEKLSFQMLKKNRKW